MPIALDVNMTAASADAAAEIATILANIKKQTANELGCLKYDITRTGDVFTLSELYQDQNAVTEHMSSKEFLELRNKSETLVKGGFTGINILTSMTS